MLIVSGITKPLGAEPDILSEVAANMAWGELKLRMPKITYQESQAEACLK